MNNATHPDHQESMQDSPALSAGHAPDEQFAYRTVSKAAIAALIFAVLGLLTAYLRQPFILIPLLAVVFGFVALVNFRKYPDELTGKLAAQIGIAIGTIVFVTAASFHVYIYQTEVPDGYQRISYYDLRIDKRRGAGLPFSPKARDLDGTKVFLKGYVRPSAQRRKLKNFLLVRDFGDCCFGGNPDKTEVVAVRILSNDTIDHGYSLRKIGGTFKLNEQARRTNDEEVPLIIYEIGADHIR